MNIAAYLAWVAIGSELWFADVEGTGLIPVNYVAATAITPAIASLCTALIMAWRFD